MQYTIVTQQIFFSATKQNYTKFIFIHIRCQMRLGDITYPAMQKYAMYVCAISRSHHLYRVLLWRTDIGAFIEQLQFNGAKW